MKKFISIVALLIMIIVPTFAKQFSIVYNTTTDINNNWIQTKFIINLSV